MLSRAIKFLEDMPAVVIRARLMKRGDKRVYTIEAKTKSGQVELFQLQGRMFYHHKVTIGKGIEEILLYQFSEQ